MPDGDGLERNDVCRYIMRIGPLYIAAFFLAAYACLISGTSLSMIDECNKSFSVEAQTKGIYVIVPIMVVCLFILTVVQCTFAKGGAGEQFSSESDASEIIHYAVLCLMTAGSVVHAVFPTMTALQHCHYNHIHMTIFNGAYRIAIPVISFVYLFIRKSIHKSKCCKKINKKNNYMQWGFTCLFVINGLLWLESFTSVVVDKDTIFRIGNCTGYQNDSNNSNCLKNIKSYNINIKPYTQGFVIQYCISAFIILVQELQWTTVSAANGGNNNGTTNGGNGNNNGTAYCGKVLLALLVLALLASCIFLLAWYALKSMPSLVNHITHESGNISSDDLNKLKNALRTEIGFSCSGILLHFFLICSICRWRNDDHADADKENAYYSKDYFVLWLSWFGVLATGTLAIFGNARCREKKLSCRVASNSNYLNWEISNIILYMSESIFQVSVLYFRKELSKSSGRSMTQALIYYSLAFLNFSWWIFDMFFWFNDSSLLGTAFSYGDEKFYGNWHLLIKLFVSVAIYFRMQSSIVCIVLAWKATKFGWYDLSWGEITMCLFHEELDSS